MIISIAPAGPGRLRRALYVVAGTGLAALLASYIDFPASAPSKVPAHTAPQARVFGGDREIALPLPRDAPEDAATGDEAPHRRIDAAPPAVAPTPPQPELPFRFLGKLDGAETSLVLYGRGRTLTVRGAGPLDDEYVVDAIEDGRLTLRHVPTGTSRTLELAARQHPVLAAGSAAETAED